MIRPFAGWRRGLAAACALGLLFAPVLAVAQSGPGASVNNAVGVWGVTSSGAPCLIAPQGATGTPTCGLPPTPGGAGDIVTANQGTPAATPWPVTTTTSQALLNNASASGSQITVTVGGNYLIGPLTGTLGGATVTVTDVNALGQSSTVGPVLAATTTSGVCYAISAGDKLTATVTGGSPSGLFLPLGSVGSGGCAGTAMSTSATNTPPVSIQQTTTTSAVQLASNALSNGAIFEIPSTNTGTVCVGSAGVTTSTGFCMSVASGITSGSLGVNNTNLISVIGTNGSDKLYVLGN